ncbi:MAG: hypothetical protein ACJZ8F_06120 [Candidatus Pelagibacter sp.]
MKKLYIYIFSIFLLFLTNVNSVEDFEKGEAYQLVRSEVPANEQWMVNRLSQQYPNLEETKIFRIQTSFGTYYGAINNRGLPHGPGILNVSKNGIPTGTALEAEFKKGKLNDTDEFKLLGITDRVFEINNEDMMVAAKNRVFNNGFDLIANVNNIVKANISKLLIDGAQCNNDICERVYDRLENINNQDYSDNPIYLFIELENLLYDILIAKDDTRYAWYRKLSNEERFQRDFMNIFFSMMGFNETRRNVDRDNYNFYSEISESISYLVGYGGYGFDDLTDFQSYVRNYVERDRNSLFNYFIKKDNPLYFSNFVLNQYLDDKNENRYDENDYNQFEEFRFVNNFNFRKDENEDVIQGKLNGKWYDLELNPNSLTYRMTDSARRDFENNNSNTNDREGGGSDW